MRRGLTAVFLLALVVTTAGCGGHRGGGSAFDAGTSPVDADSAPDAGAGRDGGTPLDAGANDTGRDADASATDAGANDAGATDAGRDADADATDAGRDANDADAGANDAGANDAGRDADADATDAGANDAGRDADASPALEAGGTWSGTWSSQELSGTATASLDQVGSSVSGVLFLDGSPCITESDVDAFLEGDALFGSFFGDTDSASIQVTITETTLTGSFKFESGTCAGVTGTVEMTR